MSRCKAADDTDKPGRAAGVENEDTQQVQT